METLKETQDKLEQTMKINEICMNIQALNEQIKITTKVLLDNRPTYENINLRN